jgi:integrase
MARKPDIRNIRERIVRRNGRYAIAYQVRVRLQDDRGMLRTCTQTFDRLPDAILWRDARRSQVRLGEIGNKLEQSKLLQGTTLGDLLHRYSAKAAGQAVGRLWCKRSAINEFSALRSFMAAEQNGLCKRSLADQELMRDDFRKYRDKRLYADGVKPGTLRRELNPIRHMFRIAALEWGYPIANPLHGLELPPEDPHRERILKPEERYRLYRAIEGCRGQQQQRLWLSLVITALTTAMRRGELLKLEWRDIDFDKGTIYLRAEITKSRKPRLLPMTGESHRNLSKYRDSIEETKRKPDARVFPMTGGALEQAWRRICERGDIPDLRFHDLRHTAATSFADPKTVNLSVRENAYVLGHSYGGIPRMTKIYENPDILEMVESIRAKLEAADRNLPPDAVPIEDLAELSQDNLMEEQHVVGSIAPWRDDLWAWKEQGGRVIIDLDHPKAQETLKLIRGQQSNPEYQKKLSKAIPPYK